MNDEIALQNLIELDNCFQKFNIQYWITDGTLLGFYRENGFISHDLDTDLGLFMSDFTPECLEYIKSRGFKLKGFFGLIEDGFEIALTRNGVKTDLFFFYNRNHKVYHSAYHKFSSDGYYKIDYEYEPFSIVRNTFMKNDFNMPNNIEKYVKTKYGEEWSIPIKNWDYAYSPLNHVKTDIKVLTQSSKRSFDIWINQ